MFRGRTVGFGLLAGALIVASACERKPKTGAQAQPKAAVGRCAKGPKEPPRAEAQPAERLLRDQQYGPARQSFDALIAKYPESGNLLVWRGDAELNDDADYVGSAQRALGFYQRARELDAQGCRLGEAEQYYLQLHSAFAHLRKDDAAQAERELRGLSQSFPESAEVQYNLARSACLRGSADECYAHFERALTLAHERARPKFLRTHYSVADWLRRSETQSELGPLRADPRYAVLVQRMASSR